MWAAALSAAPQTRQPLPPQPCPPVLSRAMSLLIISGLTIRIAGRVLLDGADLAVDPGRRIGLVGRNGAGKTTLLRAIAGEIGIDDGQIRLASRARMAVLSQEAPAGADSLLDTVLRGDPERLGLLAEV